MTNIVQFKKWYAILFSYRGLGFHCIYVFLGSPKGLVKIITSMINLNSSQFFFLSCQHLQSQETSQFNLTDNSPDKNKFLRACTQNFIHAILDNNPQKYVYMDISGINIIHKQHTGNRIGFNWDMLRDPGLTITLIRGTHNT